MLENDNITKMKWEETAVNSDADIELQHFPQELLARTWWTLHQKCIRSEAQTHDTIMICKQVGGKNYFFFPLTQPLDYETKKAYTFKVDASNAHLDPRFQSSGAFKDTATVKINVLDVDEPPVFNKPSYVMDVYEDTPAGTIIGAVTAQDLDASSSPVR